SEQHEKFLTIHDFNGLCPKSLISLCNLCVLCVSVVVFYEQFLNHRGTEDAEMAQRRSPTRTFRARPIQLIKQKLSETILSHARSPSSWVIQLPTILDPAH